MLGCLRQFCSSYFLLPRSHQQTSLDVALCQTGGLAGIGEPGGATGVHLSCVLSSELETFSLLPHYKVRAWGRVNS